MYFPQNDDYCEREGLSMNYLKKEKKKKSFSIWGHALPNFYLIVFLGHELYTCMPFMFINRRDNDSRADFIFFLVWETQVVTYW